MLARAADPWNVGRALAQLACCFSSVGAFSGCPAMLRDGIPFRSWLPAPCNKGCLGERHPDSRAQEEDQHTYLLNRAAHGVPSLREYEERSEEVIENP